MASIHTTARAHLDTLDRIANIKSTNAIPDHVKMVEHARIIITTIHAIVRMDSLERIVPSMLIGVHKIHAKMVHRAINEKTHSNVTACRAGPENCATSKWFHAKMLPSGKVLM